MPKIAQILLNILSAAGILIWGAAVFVGVHFASHCSWPVSISAAAGCILLMFFFLTLARHYAQPKANSQYGKTAVVKKWTFIGIYTVISLISSVYVIHAVACTTHYKEDIQIKASEELNELRAMINTAPAAKGSYMEYVNLQLANYRNANPNNLTDLSQIDTEVSDLYDLYVTNSGYPQLSQEIKQFGEKASWAVDNWYIFTVGKLLDELAIKKPAWEAGLIECSKKGLELEPAYLHLDFTPLHTNYPELAKPLSSPSMQGLTLGGLLTVVVLQIIILLSWLAVCVDPNKGAKGLGMNKPGFTTWSPDRH